MPSDFDFSALAKVLHKLEDEQKVSSEEPSRALHYFGDYLLEKEIARGGMGIIYKARQMTLDRVVAVKVLREGLFASGTDVERFKAEASVAGRLRHPRIVGILEIGEYEGRYFFRMEYVDGPNLAPIYSSLDPWPPHRQPLWSISCWKRSPTLMLMASCTAI